MLRSFSLALAGVSDDESDYHTIPNAVEVAASRLGLAFLLLCCCCWTTIIIITTSAAAKSESYYLLTQLS